jgi:hypothetical protein
MVSVDPQKKDVIVHLGPHKTGSTAIQRCLKENRVALAQANVLFMHDAATHDAAMELAREEFEAAEASLARIASSVTRANEATIIISQEDFCGDLPGRSRRKVIYPKLLKNLRIISRALQPHLRTRRNELAHELLPSASKTSNTVQQH